MVSIESLTASSVFVNADQRQWSYGCFWFSSHTLSVMLVWFFCFYNSAWFTYLLCPVVACFKNLIKMMMMTIVMVKVMMMMVMVMCICVCLCCNSLQYRSSFHLCNRIRNMLLKRSSSICSLEEGLLEFLTIRSRCSRNTRLHTQHRSCFMIKAIYLLLILACALWGSKVVIILHFIFCS